MNDDRKFLASHAIHSYYASTMLFDSENATLSRNSQPRWCVNEGSFMMMNTFDLAIDHAFFELSRNPWVVKNILDIFKREYSYFDNLGLSFTHDHGTHFTFSPHGYSAYEIPNQDGCFSYMTQEQLCNWILIAGLYVERTKDIDWLQQNQELLKDCFTSLLNRDAADDALLDGIMDLDSSRCGISSEITTYRLSWYRSNLQRKGKRTRLPLPPRRFFFHLAARLLILKIVYTKMRENRKYMHVCLYHPCQKPYNSYRKVLLLISEGKLEETDMKTTPTVGIIAIILGVFLALTPTMLFPVCTKMLELANGKSLFMKCHWTSMAELSIGVLLHLSEFC